MAKTIYDGLVIDGDMAVDPDILWMWQKVMDASVVRVVATAAGDVTVSEDCYQTTHHSPYRAIYLDADCIAAINHAKGVVDAAVL